MFFQVPERLRPSGWSSLIPLPIGADRKGDLTDATEVSKIQSDAADLYARLLADRASLTGGTAPVERRDMPTLNRLWQASQDFKGTKPRTQKGYAYHARVIEAWSASVNHPLVAAMPKDKIEAFLALYDDRPTTRRHLKVVLLMLLELAVDSGWMDKNPAAKIKVRAPKSKVVIWEPEDVERFSLGAALAGQPAVAAMIRTQWEIGQRLTDVRMFRRTSKTNRAAEYHEEDGVFRFWQEKTQSYVTVPISDALRGMLDDVKVEGSPYLFLDAYDLQPFDEQRLGHLFIAMKAAMGEKRRLTLRGLRHACVVQMARGECTPPEIAAITGHSLATVNQILSVYLPRDNEVAWNAQAKRGLVKARRGKGRRTKV